MTRRRAEIQKIAKRVRRYGGGRLSFLALTLAAKACADLSTAPQVRDVSIVYVGPPSPEQLPANPPRRIVVRVGQVVAPTFEVRISGLPQSRARYAYGFRDSLPAGVIAINAKGDSVHVLKRGDAWLYATVVGATINDTIKIRDSVLVTARADRNAIFFGETEITASTPVDTLESFDETKDLDAKSFDAQGDELTGGNVVWRSTNPAVATVDATTGVVTAKSDGTTDIWAVFESVDSARVRIDVVQKLAKYRMTPNGLRDFFSFGDSVQVSAAGFDALDHPFIGPNPPAPNFVIRGGDEKFIEFNSATGYVKTLKKNTSSESRAMLLVRVTGAPVPPNDGGTDTLRISTQQKAATIQIQAGAVDTIPSLGIDKLYRVTAEDANRNPLDLANDITWSLSDFSYGTITKTSTAGEITVKASKITGGTPIQLIASAPAAGIPSERTSTINLVITNDAARIEIAPAIDTILALNDTISFDRIDALNGNNQKLNVPITLSSPDSTTILPLPDNRLVGKKITTQPLEITATAPNGVFTKALIHVTNAPDLVQIAEDTITLASVGNTATPTVTFKNRLGVDLAINSVTWTSGRTDVATVTPTNGLITAVGQGLTYILAVSPGNPSRRDSVWVNVTNAVTSVEVTPATAQTLTSFGETMQFLASPKNAGGTTVSTAVVTWSVPVGGAFLSINSTGLATALANGVATVRATAGGVSTDVQVTVGQVVSTTTSTITPLPASITANNTSTSVITVQLRDARGNNIAFGGSTVALATSAGTLGAVGDSTAGRYVAVLTSGLAATTATVTGTVNGQAISGNALVTFTAAPAAKYVVTTANTNPIVGDSITISAQLADANNNAVPTAGQVVTWSSTGGGGFAAATSTTNASGVATIRFRVSTTVGATHIVTATTGTNTGSSPSIAPIAAGASQYVVTAATTSPATGSGVVITAQLADAAGNAVATAGQTVSWTKSDANGSFSAGTSTTDANGRATITLTTHTVTGTATTVTATTGTNVGTSATITTVSGTAVASTSTATVPAGTVGGTTTIAIQAKDAFGNNRTSTSGTVAVTISGANTTSATVIDNLNGTYTATYTPTVAGTDNVTITLNGAAISGSPFTSAVANSTLSTTAALSVTTNGSEAGPTNIVYTVTLGAPNTSGSPITFTLTNSGGTATSGSDFTAFGGAAAITVASGATTGTLTVAVTNDALLEATETVQATLSAPSNGGITISTPTATANITDNETTTAALSVTTNGTEAGTSIVYTVTLSAANNTGAPITFDVSNSGGSATSGSDFTAFGGTGAISVANGASTGTLTVAVTNDALLEATESVQATISNPGNSAVSITTASVSATITDDDGASASLSVTTHGTEAGPVNIVYTVTLTAANNTGSPITFDLTNTGGSATSGSDFAAFGGTGAISVANGATTGTLSVTVFADALVETTETVAATISNASNAAVGFGTTAATANITDDDVATANLSVTTQGVEAASPTSVVYTVTLSSANNTGSPITFTLANSGGTATSGTDFTAFGGVGAISVANGATTGTLTVTLADDALLEGTETVQATLSAPSNASVSIGTATATANISDDETATAALSVTTAGVEGGANVVYTVTLSRVNNTGAAISFDIDDATSGSAVAGSDYTAIPATATVTVANGQSTGTFTVTVTNDVLLEGTETVAATISNPTHSAVSVATPTATANITDNETATAALSVTTHGSEAGPVAIVYTVTLSTTNNTGAAITFNLADSTATAPVGTATSGSDYSAFGGAAAISIANGASTGTLTVTVLNDAVFEATETVKAKIDTPSNPAVSITTGLATANIVDNEGSTAALSVTTQGVEGGTNIVYTVTLSSTNNTGSPITFDLTNSGGTATSGSDFTAFGGAGVISVANGVSTGTLTVTVTNDLALEGSETVQATLSNASSGAVTITTASATANITDNESATANLSVTTQGNEAGAVAIVYTVDLGVVNNTGSAITFNVANSGGTASAGFDFTAFGGVGAISVANGQSTGTLLVSVANDGLLEGTETVQATISNSSNAAVTIGTATATANITDNESATADLSVTTHGSEAGPVAIVYTVTLSTTNNTGAAITFNLADSTAIAPLGTATSGSDYSAFGGTISVANGASTGTLTVTVLNDAVLETTETVKAKIDSPSNAAVTIGTALATANIVDNESATAALSVTTQGVEGATNIVYTVTLSSTNNTGAAITFDLANSGGTATSGSDFTAFGGAGTISVANGVSTGTLTVTVTNDLALEGTETVQATLSNASSASVTITTASATANITDNESATANLSVTTHGTEAGPVAIVYTVDLGITNTTGSAITFAVANSGGSATSASDFTAFGGPAAITVANGQQTGTLTVSVANDGLLEGTETVQATISNSSNAAVTIGTATATANITDNESATADLSVTTHGSEAGPVAIVYTVTLSTTNNTGAAITFNLADSTAIAPLGTATSGSDYSAFGGTISVANGASTGTLTVTVLNDAALETTETVKAKIDSPSNAAVTIGTALATANIVDNESATAALSVTTQGVEGGTNIVYTVTLSSTNNTGAAITFDLANSGGTATSGSDFTAFGGAGTISVANGVSTGTLTVTVTNDLALEGTETVQATLSNASSAAVTITGATATANISDNETATANLSVTTQGNEAGTVAIVYTVDLGITNNTGSAITFNVANSGGTAVAGSDFTAFAGTGVLSVANGASTGTLTVPVTDDALLESVETVQATISNPSLGSVTIGTATVIANITDNESATATLSVSQHGLEAGPVNIVYTVTLDATNTTGAPITFDLDEIAGGTATAGSDFTTIPANQKISVPNGSATGTYTVVVADDALLEGTESLVAQISNSSSGVVTVSGAGQATANITDDDTATASLSVSQHGSEAGALTHITYTVTLSKANNTQSAITFDFDDLGTGSATSGADYTAVAGAATVSVGTGQSTGTVTVTVLADALLEGTQTVVGGISNPSFPGVSVSGASATANIVDDETATATLSVGTHGVEGSANIVFSVDLGIVNNTGSAITFDVANSGGTATAASGDFTAFAGTAALSVAAGAQTGTLTVTVANDALLENLETVQATISNPSLAAVTIAAGGVATANLTESGATAVLSVSQQGSEATTPTNIVYTVTLNKTNATGGAVTFNLADSTAVAPLGTATAGSDYTAFGGTNTISVADGASTGTFGVTVLNDALLENTETVKAKINSPSHASVTISTGLATANIVDNETATAALSVTTHGAESGPTAIVYTVTLNRTNNTGAPITFSVSNSGGTATSGTDFTAFGGATALSVAHGATTGTLSVPVTDDALLENTETVEASISDASLASISITTPTALANIVESGATATLSASSPTEGSDAVFTVTLDKTNTTGGAITFTIARSGGSTTAGTDHGAISTPISVANNATTGQVSVATSDDALLENSETLIATISSPSSAAVTIGTASATATIAEAGGRVFLTSANATEGSNVVYTATLKNTAGTVTKTNETGSNVTVTIADDAGTATSGSDYTAFGSTINIAGTGGVSTATLNVATSDDAFLENTETVEAKITATTSAGSNVTFDAATISADILEAGGRVFLTSANATEGSNVVYTATLKNTAGTVTKTNETGSNVTVTIADDAGTATSGNDYTAFGSTINIAGTGGVSTATLNVATSDDAFLENTETVEAKITATTSAGSNVTFDATTSSADILEAGGRVFLTAANGTEGTSNVVYTATLKNTAGTVTKTNETGSNVAVTIADVTGAATTPPDKATSGTDYTAFGSTINIAGTGGVSAATLTVTVTNDALLEDDESVYAEITGVTSAGSNVTFDGSDIAGTIISDDAAEASITTTTNGTEGSQSIVYTVALTKVNGTGDPITFNIAKTAGSAQTGGVDVTLPAATVSIANGTDQVTYTVTVVDDALLEDQEDLELTISGTPHAQVSIAAAPNNAATATITEAGGRVFLTAANATEGSNIVYTATLKNAAGTVTKTNETGSNVSVTIADDVGTATSGTDYTAFGSTINIAGTGGVSTATLSVATDDDTFLEDTETLEAKITATTSEGSNVTFDGATSSANLLETGARVFLTAANGTEGTSNVVYTATLKNTAGTVTKTNETGTNVAVTIADITGAASTPPDKATSGTDYTAFGSTINIAGTGGVSAATLTVTVTDDALLEDDESVYAEITGVTSESSNVTFDGSDITAVILSDDAAEASITTTTNGTEGSQSIVYTVSLTKVNGTGDPITFNIAKTAGSALTGGVDVTLPAATVSIANGTDQVTYTVTVVDDALLEDQEDLELTISGTPHTQVSIAAAPNNAATATITEAGGRVFLTAANGTEGTSNVVYTATLKNTAGTVTKTNETGSNVAVTIADATAAASTPPDKATSGSDYTAFGSTINIAGTGGVSTATLTVTVTNDALLEDDESVYAEITGVTSEGSNVTFPATAVAATIASEDAAEASITTTTNGTEGSQSIVYTVALTKVNGTGDPITFNIAKTAGSAQTGGVDVTLPAATVSIANGTDQVTYTVTVVDDALLEDQEDLELTISGTPHAQVSIAAAPNNAATATITEAGGRVFLTAANATEGSNIVYTATLKNAAGTVTKTNETGSNVSVTIADDVGTATSGTDYTAFGSTINIAGTGGVSTATLSVATDDDTFLEDTETLEAKITATTSEGSNVTFDGTTSSANLLEAGGRVFLTAANATEGSNIVFTATLKNAAGTVTKTNETGTNVSVTIADDAGTATSGTDYTAFGSTINIAGTGGVSAATLNVATDDDTFLEDTETLEAKITATTSEGSNVTFDGATSSANLLEAGGQVFLTAANATEGSNIVFTATLKNTAGTVTKTNETGTNVTVTIADDAGTATSGTDYTAFGSTINIAGTGGVSAATLNVATDDDTFLEDTETLEAKITATTSEGSNVTFDGATSSANLLEAGGQVFLTAANGTEGTSNVVYTATLKNAAGTVTKTNETGTDVTVTIADVTAAASTPPDKATSGSDYTAFGSTISIAGTGGVSAQTLTVTVADDALLENLEAVYAEITGVTSEGSNVTFDGSDIAANIIEAGAVAHIESTGDGAEPGTPVPFRIFLRNAANDQDKTNVTGSPITFTLADATAGGSAATVTLDYTDFAATTVDVAHNSNDATFTVVVLDDASPEATETVSVTISEGHASVTVGTPTATGNILDDGDVDDNLLMLSSTAVGVVRPEANLGPFDRSRLIQALAA